MKKADIATLILIVGVVGIGVFFILQLVIGDQSLQAVNVETAREIPADIVSPSPTIFNGDAINPTVPITIEGGDQKPIGN